MKREIVIGSNNQGKVQEIRAALAALDIAVFSLQDIGVVADVAEGKSTLGENALLKAQVYAAFAGARMVLSDDTGLEIAALCGEPGIHVRRWKGYRMTDEEIIAYTLQRLSDVPKSRREAQFRTSLALAIPEQETEVFEGILHGTILEQPRKERTEGLPFDALFYCEEWGLTLGEVHHLSAEAKASAQIYTHRERALNKVAVRLLALFENPESRPIFPVDR